MKKNPASLIADILRDIKILDSTVREAVNSDINKSKDLLEKSQNLSNIIHKRIGDTRRAINKL